MSVLPGRQIGALIVEVGAFGVDMRNKPDAIAKLDVAIAVCLAESGGNTQAKNGSSSASGLWQIMASVHADLIKTQAALYGVKKHKTLDVFDPHVNTACAATLYNQRQWQPWVAYTSGSYRKHLGQGQAAFTYIEGQAIIAGATKTASGGVDPNWWAKNAEKLDSTPKDLDAIGRAIDDTAAAFNPANAVTKVLGFLKDAGIAVGVFILGLIVLILGIWFIVSNSATGKAVSNVVPIKRFVK